MQLLFADANPEVSSALSDAFRTDDRVEVVFGDVFALDIEGILLAPGNSYGFMDGGFDRKLAPGAFF
ncbi:MAG: hypothetical protein AAGM22_26455 [Acidobacteriota bacterium]